MPTQGPLVCSSMTGWGNNLPAYISSSNNVYDGPLSSPVLAIAKGFGFTIPAGATINSIQLTIEHHYENPLSSYAVGLTKNGSTLAGSSVTCAPGFFTDVTENFTGLFGSTWTAAEINAATFGAVLIPGDVTEFGGDWEVDLLTLSVDYTATTLGAPAKTTRAKARIFQFLANTRIFTFNPK